MYLTLHSGEKINVLFNSWANFPVVDLFKCLFTHQPQHPHLHGLGPTWPILGLCQPVQVRTE